MLRLATNFMVIGFGVISAYIDIGFIFFSFSITNLLNLLGQMMSKRQHLSKQNIGIFVYQECTMSIRKVDYLVIGSGIAGLSF